MKTIAFFNNKGGVGKTSLVYHTAQMLAELEYRVITADLDPQANLSGMFIDDERLEKLWDKNGHTIERDLAPLFDGTGDISDKPFIEKISERVGLLVGNLSLSKREDELSAQWPRCLAREPRAFRVMTAFSRLINYAGNSFKADIALIDVGPNLGAINRAALIASDFVIIPLAPDLFSIQGLRNVGPTLKIWRDDWQERIDKRPENLGIELPSGKMMPAGYIIMRHSVLLSKPVRAYGRWIDKVPDTYRDFVISNESTLKIGDSSNDKHRLAHLKDYRSLMPLAQEARKPMFSLKPADGAIGAQQSAVTDCYADFKKLAQKIIDACSIPKSSNLE